MATGALQALDAAGLTGKVGVTGFDANTDIVQAIADGNATATISSNGYLQGGYTLAICYAVWTGLLDVTQIPEDYRIFATPLHGHYRRERRRVHVRRPRVRLLPHLLLQGRLM